MYKCPQCGEMFAKEKAIIEHLKVDNRGNKLIAGKMKKNQMICPSWPLFQIDYYKVNGLLEE